jgi:hypothetical protein
VVAIAGVAIAIGMIIHSGGSGSSNGTSGPSASTSAVTVKRRDLVATDTESGTLGYTESHTVYDRFSGTITSLPAVGQVIGPGQTMYRIADEPVVLFNGSTPAYRDLSSSDSAGPDILELNRDLKALGFDSGNQITVDDVWQAGTTDAVGIWQGSLGLTETGVIALGQIVFLPGSQRITAVDTVLGSTGQSAGGASSGGASSASTTVIPRTKFVDLTTATTSPTGAGSAPTIGGKPLSGSSGVAPLSGSSKPSAAATSGNSAAILSAMKSSDQARSRDSAAVLQALKALLKAETAQLKRSNSSSSSASGSKAANGSSGGAAAQAILQTASTKLVVSVQLDATKRSEAVAGERVTVEMPDGTVANGRVTRVSSVAQTSSSSSSNSVPGGGSSSGAPSATIPVTIALTGHHRSLAGLDQAAVSVNFVQQRARHVLSVPVTALLATAGGGYDVQEATLPHRLIAVRPGLFAAGYVQISGAGIHAGLQVTDSQG